MENVCNVPSGTKDWLETNHPQRPKSVSRRILWGREMKRADRGSSDGRSAGFQSWRGRAGNRTRRGDGPLVAPDGDPGTVGGELG